MALTLSILAHCLLGRLIELGEGSGSATSAAPAITATPVNSVSTVQPASGFNSRPVPTGGDTCRLVTKAEAAALVGRDVQDAETTSHEEATGTVSSCMYRAAPLQTAIAITLILR